MCSASCIMECYASIAHWKEIALIGMSTLILVPRLHRNEFGLVCMEKATGEACHKSIPRQRRGQVDNQSRPA